MRSRTKDGNVKCGIARQTFSCCTAKPAYRAGRLGAFSFRIDDAEFTNHSSRCAVRRHVAVP